MRDRNNLPDVWSVYGLKYVCFIDSPERYQDAWKEVIQLQSGHIKSVGFRCGFFATQILHQQNNAEHLSPNSAIEHRALQRYEYCNIHLLALNSVLSKNNNQTHVLPDLGGPADPLSGIRRYPISSETLEDAYRRAIELPVGANIPIANLDEPRIFPIISKKDLQEAFDLSVSLFLKSPDERRLLSLIRESSLYYARGNWDAGFVIAWAVAEISAFKVIDNFIQNCPQSGLIAKPKPKDRTMGSAIKFMYANDLIDEAQFDTLEGARASRNALVHKLKPIEPNDLSFLISEAAKILTTAIGFQPMIPLVRNGLI